MVRKKSPSFDSVTKAKGIKRSSSAPFKCCTIFVAILSIMCLLLYIFFNDVVEMGVRSQLKLQEGNDIYKQWTKVPIPVNYRYHFFEILNPNEVLQGQKMKLLERGPYCFK